MVWIIVGGVVGLVVWGAFIADAFDTSPWRGVDWFDVLIGGGALGGLFAVMAAAAVAAALNGIMLPILGGNHQPESATYRLQAIAARSDVHGEFFLGSGQVDSDPAYRFYRDTPSGGFVLDSADAATTVIYQDSSTPRVVERWNNAHHPWWCLFWTGGTPTYEIHVPQGSITATTNLDLP